MANFAVINLTINSAGAVAGAAQANRALQNVAQNAQQAQRKVGASAGFIDKQISTMFATFTRFFTALIFVRAFDNLIQGAKEFISVGLSLNSTLEDARLGIAALVASAGSFKNIQTGVTLEGMDEFNAALHMADEQLAKLRADNLKTAATFEELVRGYQQALGPGLAAGLNLDQIRALTVDITNAALVARVPLREIGQELRAILAGEIDVNARIAKALQISNEMVKKWQQQNTLAQELNKRFEKFRVVGELIKQTMSGAVSNLKDTVATISAEITEPAARAIVVAANSISDAFTQVTAKGGVELTKGIQGLVTVLERIVAVMGVYFVDAVRKATEAVIALGGFLKTNNATVDQITVSIDLMGRGLWTSVAAAMNLNDQTKEWDSRFSKVGMLVEAIGGAFMPLVDTVELAAAGLSHFVGWADTLWLKFRRNSLSITQEEFAKRMAIATAEMEKAQIRLDQGFVKTRTYAQGVADAINRVNTAVKKMEPPKTPGDLAGVMYEANRIKKMEAEARAAMKLSMELDKLIGMYRQLEEARRKIRTEAGEQKIEESFKATTEALEIAAINMAGFAKLQENAEAKINAEYVKRLSLLEQEKAAIKERQQAISDDMKRAQEQLLDLAPGKGFGAIFESKTLEEFKVRAEAMLKSIADMPDEARSRIMHLIDAIQDLIVAGEQAGASIREIDASLKSIAAARTRALDRQAEETAKKQIEIRKRLTELESETTGLMGDSLKQRLDEAARAALELGTAIADAFDKNDPRYKKALDQVDAWVKATEIAIHHEDQLGKIREDNAKVQAEFDTREAIAAQRRADGKISSAQQEEQLRQITIQRAEATLRALELEDEANEQRLLQTPKGTLEYKKLEAQMEQTNAEIQRTIALIKEQERSGWGEFWDAMTNKAETFRQRMRQLGEDIRDATKSLTSDIVKGLFEEGGFKAALEGFANRMRDIFADQVAKYVDDLLTMGLKALGKILQPILSRIPIIGGIFGKKQTPADQADAVITQTLPTLVQETQTQTIVLDQILQACRDQAACCQANAAAAAAGPSNLDIILNGIQQGIQTGISMAGMGSIFGGGAGADAPTGITGSMTHGSTAVSGLDDFNFGWGDLGNIPMSQSIAPMGFAAAEGVPINVNISQPSLISDPRTRDQIVQQFSRELDKANRNN